MVSGQSTEGLFFNVGTGCYKSATGLVAFKLVEVVDEHVGEFVGLGVPLGRVGVGVARVEDFRVNAGKFGRNFKVEDGEFLGGSLEDSAVEDGVDDAAGILDGDALAGTVPAGVDEISLCAALFHALNEFFGILGGVERQECCAKASRECRGRLGDAALGAGQLSGEAGQEIVLSLLGGQDGDRRQHAKSVGAQEDDILGGGTA